ncbi:unnamed protein product, partial [Ectocarpus fasciculatus]
RKKRHFNLSRLKGHLCPSSGETSTRERRGRAGTCSTVVTQGISSRTDTIWERYFRSWLKPAPTWSWHKGFKKRKVFATTMAVKPIPRTVLEEKLVGWAEGRCWSSVAAWATRCSLSLKRTVGSTSSRQTCPLEGSMSSSSTLC